jgi:uncharacterized membrane protein
VSGAVGLAVTVFLACLVEAVEAVTIVLAMGTTRGRRSAALGTAAALLVLACVVAILGPALTVVPLGVLRVVVGGLLLVFGLQWLRKAILRASGRKALHDEDAIFAAEQEEARRRPTAGESIDPYGFGISFKGVLLEGFEVVFIVLTFGSNQGKVGLAAAAAAAAVLVVVGIAFALRAPLNQVPENALKFAVGILLTSFGTFWAAEGVGASWPGGDTSLLALVPAVLVWALLLVRASSAGSRGQRRPATAS